MPAKLRAQAKAAIERHQARPITPDVAVVATSESWSYANPYVDSEELGWCALLFEAFGTRQRVVADVFIHHLAEICSAAWDDDARALRPNQAELQTGIAIVRSMAPKNEAQAALAAQAVAIHFTMMKLARSMAVRSDADHRSAASLAALGKTYARQLETLQRLQGKRTSKQKITVRNVRHIHQHVHVTGGGAEKGGQAHATIECRARRDGARPSVSGQDAAGHTLPMCGDEGPLALPPARRGERVRRSGR